MNLKLVITAMALAVTPMLASASTITPSGGAVVDGTAEINIGDIWTVGLDDFDIADGAGSFFVGATAGTALLTVETNSLNGANSFANATAEWNTASDGSGDTLASITLPEINNSENKTYLEFDEGDTRYLIVSWTGVVEDLSDLDVRITATAVPVPAGILLMGTALAGFGVMRRRKKVA